MRRGNPGHLTASEQSLSPAARALLESRAGLAGTARHARRARRPGERAPLSYAQQRMWLHERVEPGAAYQVPKLLRLRGPLDAPALERALRLLVERHEVLRTRYVVDADGIPWQDVLPPEAALIPLRRLDLPADLPAAEVERAARARLAALAAQPFDLGAGPLPRATLARLDGEEYLLQVVFHHIAFDGWSTAVFVRDLGLLYNAGVGSPDTLAALPPLPIQFAEHALLERERAGTAEAARDLAHLRARLADAPEADFPADRPRPVQRTYAGAMERLDLPAALVTDIRSLARSEGATLFAAILAGFQALLARHAAIEDVVVGSPVAGRGHADVDGLIGPFINTLVIRTDLSGDPTFRELLRRARDASREAFARAGVPFDALVEALKPQRRPGRNPVFQVMLNYRDLPVPEPCFAGLEVTVERAFEVTSLVDLDLEVTEHAGGLYCDLIYATELFEQVTARRLLRRLGALLEGIAAQPETPLSRLPLLPAEERELVLGHWAGGPPWRTPTAGAERRLEHAFAARALQSPAAPAVVGPDGALTYGQLLARSRAIGARLRSAGLRPGERAGIALGRGTDQIAAVLGVLSAGAAYVPLDGTGPPERRAFIEQDAALRLVVDEAFMAGLAGASDPDPDDVAGDGLAGEAYVIYTSGSTGVPKGVAVGHSSVLALAGSVAALQELSPSDRVLQFAPLVFDLSVEEIFPTLLAGATLVLRPEEMLGSMRALVGVLERERITVAQLPTALWHELASALEAGEVALPDSLRLLVVGTERASPDRAEAWLRLAPPHVRLLHCYGPTESTVTATAADLSVVPLLPGSPLPIGRPLPHARAYVLDAAGAPVPAGVPGELVIGGAGVAIGYVGRGSAASERFIADPFGGSGRLYRTGDRARWRFDGLLEFLGRLDGQVKIRGMRVEPAEAEAVLCACPGVAAGAVLVREGPDGGAGLVACYVPGAGAALSSRDLREHMRRHLPDALVPGTFVAIRALPVGPTGKVDRQALAEAVAARPREPGPQVQAPSTREEAEIARIFCEVLSLPAVGLNDDFFELGGHSLQATRVASRIWAALGVEVQLATIFQCPTVLSLAAAVAELRDSAGAAQGARQSGALPGSPPAELQGMLVDWNANGAAVLPDRTVHALVEEQAALRPRALAVLSADGTALTYGELNLLANRFAALLRRRGAGAGDRVAVLLPRSPELIIALLGILKAGAAYVPLEASDPAERLSFQLADAEVALVVARELPAEVVVAVPVLHPDELATVPETEGVENPPAVPPDTVAYVMYTSGSTGAPKGVLVEHRNIIRIVRGNYVRLGPDEVVLQLAPVAFDASTFEIWGALVNGGRLVLAPPGAEALDRLGELIRGQGVTTMWLTAALFERVMETDPAALDGLEQLLTGGDVVPPAAARRFLERYPGASLINGYGPTETTVFAATYPIRPADTAGPIPIGRPVDATQLYVLDETGQPLPAGEQGELYIGGAGVARGYLNRPELTAEKFVADPFTPGGRLYRTGDRVRWRADGLLEFLGRLDSQIKIRGFRVEPGEVEAALAETPGVGQCAVVGVRDPVRGPRLVAYYVPSDLAAPIPASALRAALKQRLPAYMVPSAFEHMAALPINRNGKVDRQQLSEMALAGHGDAHADVSAPGLASHPDLTAVESTIAGVWAELLERPAVGRSDDFFELGGHSLMATVAATRIGAALGVRVPLKLLFLHPTVEGLAAEIESGNLEAAGPALAAQASLGRRVPLSAAQRRLYFLEQLVPDTATYNVAEAVTFTGRLDEAALQRALELVVQRHEQLRAVFRDDGGLLEQAVAPPGPVPLPVTDLSTVAPAEREQELARFLRIEASWPFDLRVGPPLRARLVRLEPQVHVLLLVIHHIVTDGWSMEVLRQELSTAYDAFVAGSAPELPELPLSYADYVAWEADLAGGRLQVALEYWRHHLRELPAMLPLPRIRTAAGYGDVVPGQVEPAQGLRPNTGGDVRVSIPAHAAEAVRALARRAGATPHAVLFSAYALLLARECALERFIVGCTATGRPRPELERLIGFFVSTMPLRADVSGDPTVSELVVRMRDEILTGVTHQEAPLESIVATVNAPRAAGRAPLVQVAFSLAPLSGAKSAFSGLESTWTEISTATAKFELALLLTERNGGFDGRLEYDARRFGAADAERLTAAYYEILRELCAHPDRKLSALALPTPPGEVARREPLPTLGSMLSAAPHSRPGLVAPRDELEQRITALWCELLDLPEVGVTEDFFDLGGHSLLALELLARLGTELGRAPLLGDFVHEPTIEATARLVAQEAAPADSQRVTLFHEGVPGLPPLFFLHGHYFGGMGQVSMRRLLPHLDPQPPIYLVEPYYPGGPDTVEAMGADVVREIRAVRPRGPYILAGFCNGGALALEVAQQFRRAGDEVPMVVALDWAGSFALVVPFWQWYTRLARRLRLPERWARPGAVRILRRTVRWWADGWSRCYRPGHGVRSLFAFGGWTIEYVWRRVRRRLGLERVWEFSTPEGQRSNEGLWFMNAVLARYIPVPYAGRVAVIATGNADLCPLHGWQRINPGTETHVIAGDHDSIFDEYAAELGSELRRVLVRVFEDYWAGLGSGPRPPVAAATPRPPG